MYLRTEMDLFIPYTAITSVRFEKAGCHFEISTLDGRLHLIEAHSFTDDTFIEELFENIQNGRPTMRETV